MVTKDQLIQDTDYRWIIPQSLRGDMQVPCHVYALEEMLPHLTKDRSLQQLMNVATLPGIVKAAIVMPDAHEGYGFPIGGVAATQYPDGVISPGGIGYDINCGVRLLVTDLHFEDVKDKLEVLSKECYRQIPSGFGKNGRVKLSMPQMNRVLSQGSPWAVAEGYGFEEDLKYTESKGHMDGADPQYVSAKAKKRGNDQLGTIGSGNHFAEVDRVDKILNPSVAKAYGLDKGQIVILIHTGSRGVGHQIATEAIRTMLQVMHEKYGIELPDRELACVPFNSEEGQAYYKAMLCAANYAFANRQVITWEVREALKNVFGTDPQTVRVLYDVAHNIAKIEEHPVGGGKRQKLIVHRKGATRSFGPRSDGLPEKYQKVGQPVLIPGSMGTASYVLSGTTRSEEETFGSSCHGAGRTMSRRQAKKQVEAGALVTDLRARGIYVQAGSKRGVAEEAPLAYKDVDAVVETVHRAGLAVKVALLRPLAVVKG